MKKADAPHAPAASASRPTSSTADAADGEDRLAHGEVERERRCSSREAAAGLVPKQSSTPRPDQGQRSRPAASGRPSTTRRPARVRSVRAKRASSVVDRVGHPVARLSPQRALAARSWTAARKASPRSSKSANWSNEAQAGESSTMASSPAALASAKAARDGGLDRAAAGVGRLAVQRRGERVLGLADQVGLGHRAEQVGQALDAAGLRLAAGDPVDLRVAATAPGGRRRRWWPC